MAVYQTKEGLVGFEQVFRIFEDSRGDIWASTAADPNGLARWERASETFRRDLADSPGLPPPADDLARSFGEDRSGNVWIGFGTGLARYREGRFTFFDAEDGLPPGGIQNIYSDRRGRLWLASARSGLIRVDDPAAERPAFKSYTTAEGLSSNSTEAIIEDHAGTSTSGRDAASTGSTPRRIASSTSRPPTVWLRAKLLPPSATSKALLWFGTSKGLSRFVPGADAPAQPPPVLITGLHVAGVRQSIFVARRNGGRPARPRGGSESTPDRFRRLEFAPGEVLRYQYRLEGADADWSAPTEQRTVNFASLAPGRYRFLVRAVNCGRRASPAPAAITFTILRPVWQRWWFLSLSRSPVAALAYALYRYRVARLLEVERGANAHRHRPARRHRRGPVAIAMLSEVAGPTRTALP